MLIFAIQMRNPMSFYIFDEIDASLDKENSKKLSRLMKELSKSSQVIMVSHNDSMITAADTAIGVMQEERRIEGCRTPAHSNRNKSQLGVTLANKPDPKKRDKGINTIPFYVALVVVFVLFIIYQSNGSLSVIFGIALFMMIVVIIVIEVTNGIKEQGALKNFMEIAVAIILVIIFWFGLKAVLHTNYPIDVVPSCSMLPQLKRGDLILLNGITSINSIKAPIINITNASYIRFRKNIQKEFLSCVAYNQTGSIIKLAQTLKPGYAIGLYQNSNQFGGQIVPNQYQNNNLVQFTCGAQNIVFGNGTTAQEAYTTSVTINGTVINGDKNNSIIVYATTPNDYFYSLGDSYIVHRVYAVLNVSGNYYVLTKGDNNPGLDMQYQNYPVNITDTQGKEIASVPYLGYLKLVLSSSFSEPAGCNSTVQNN